MKRALSFALSLLLILMMIPLGTFAAGAETAATSGTTGDCTWTLDGTVLTISGNGKMGDYNPPWGKNITSVVIENGVTSIGGYAFAGCTSLSSVTIPDSVTSIGGYAFSGCTSLTSVIIPDGVTMIDRGAFSGCTGFTSVTIPDSVTSIGDHAFRGCTGLTTLTVPGSTVSQYAFSNCTGLIEVTLKNGVTSLALGVFQGCTSLRRVVLPDSLTRIGLGAFDRCPHLGPIDIPDSVTFLDSGAFCWTGTTPSYGSDFCLRVNPGTEAAKTALKHGIPFLPYSGTTGDCTWTLDENGNLSILGEGAMADYEWKEIDYNYWRSTAPWGPYITSLTVGDGVTNLGDYAFTNCERLASVSLPYSIRYTGTKVFSGCKGLTDENGFVIVGGVLYNYYGENSSVVVPEGVILVEDDAFLNHRDLVDVTLPDTVMQVNADAFNGCYNLWRTDSTYVRMGNWIIWYSSGLVDFVIPDGVIGIANNNYLSRSSLNSVSLPSSLRYIGDFAFAGADHLTEIDLPDGVISIGNAAFFNCVGLKKVTEHASVLAIGEAAFSVWYEGDESYSPLPELTVYTSQGTLTQRYAEAYGIPVVASEHVHNVSDWILLQAPTCTEKGMEVRGCYFCDDLDEYREVLALGHDYDAVVTEPTCTEDGYTTHTCSRCGDSYVDAYTKPNGHAFSDWTQTKAPTCTEKGQESHTCSRCGETETRDVDPLEHDFSLPAHKDAGGRVDGYDGHICSRCGELKIDAVLPATGIATDLAGDFDWDNEVTDEDAIWLLMYTFFPEDYPITDAAACDYDGDGEITDEDAIWLLMYTFFPEDYPIV